MRISDWSSDVCSSDLSGAIAGARRGGMGNFKRAADRQQQTDAGDREAGLQRHDIAPHIENIGLCIEHHDLRAQRSEEHTSELQSLMRISYAVFCLKKKNTITPYHAEKLTN